MQLDVFISYSHKDRSFRNKLASHLSNLREQAIINDWYDGDILPGMEWKEQIIEHLNTAQIILLLISANFMASEFCHSTEMKRAIERHKCGEAYVIPIILRPTDWIGAPFDKLKVLPTDGKPVTRWPTHDDAFEDVVKGIRRAINELNAKAIRKYATTSINRIQFQKGDIASVRGVNIIFNSEFSIAAQKSKEQWLNEGIAYSRVGRYEEALIAFNEAIQRDINFVEAHNNKGIVLRVLNRHEEALAAYDRAIQFNPNFAPLYNGRGNILLKISHYEEALTAYNQAIQLDANYVEAYTNKGMALRGLSRFEEALSAFEKAIQINPDYATAYVGKGSALRALNHPEEAIECFEEEALIAYERAIELEPNNSTAYENKANLLTYLERIEEAVQAYDKAKLLGYSKQ